MTFRVIWLTSLLGKLAAYFLSARERGHDPNAITAAVASIDSRLKNNPSSQGESRPGGERILIELPLAADFEVVEEEQIVVVLRVRYIEPRSA